MTGVRREQRPVRPPGRLLERPVPGGARCLLVREMSVSANGQRAAVGFVQRPHVAVAPRIETTNVETRPEVEAELGSPVGSVDHDAGQTLAIKERERRSDCSARGCARYRSKATSADFPVGTPDPKPPVAPNGHAAVRQQLTDLRRAAARGYWFAHNKAWPAEVQREVRLGVPGDVPARKADESLKELVHHDRVEVGITDSRSPANAGDHRSRRRGAAEAGECRRQSGRPPARNGR